MPQHHPGDEPPDDALLSDADRRGIAAIRAELEREFAAAQTQRPPERPVVEVRGSDERSAARPRAAARTAAPRPRRRVGLIVAGGFVAGCLVGAATVVGIREHGGDFTADVALIRTGSPEIVTKPDGLVLTRFRKRYVLEGARVRRRGEVVQELEWSRNADGWKIVSERDAEVLSRW